MQWARNKCCGWNVFNGPINSVSQKKENEGERVKRAAFQ